MNEEVKAYAVVRAAQERVRDARRELEIAQRALGAAIDAHLAIVNGGRDDRRTQVS
jgi:hypothetical protein